MEQIFGTAEEIINQRLSESAGDEDLTMKTAGYNSVWKPFVENIFKEGFDGSVKRASLLDIPIGLDPFAMGQNMALQEIDALSQDPVSRGWYSFVKEAHDHPDHVVDFEKRASMGSDDPEEIGFNLAFEQMVSSGTDLATMALTGPITMENKNMSSFEMGKYAAFEDLYELADAGYSFTDALAVIDETLNAPLGKYASHEDDEYRLGVDALCYDFLKQAHNMFGSFDTSDSYDEDMFLYVFDKIAEEEEEDKKSGPGFVSRHKGKLIGGALAAGGLAYGGKKALNLAGVTGNDGRYQMYRSMEPNAGRVRAFGRAVSKAYDDAPYTIADRTDAWSKSKLKQKADRFFNSIGERAARKTNLQL